MDFISSPCFDEPLLSRRTRRDGDDLLKIFLRVACLESECVNIYRWCSMNKFSILYAIWTYYITPILRNWETLVSAANEPYDLFFCQLRFSIHSSLWVRNSEIFHAYYIPYLILYYCYLRFHAPLLTPNTYVRNRRCFNRCDTDTSVNHDVTCYHVCNWVKQFISNDAILIVPASLSSPPIPCNYLIVTRIIYIESTSLWNGGTLFPETRNAETRWPTILGSV